MANPTVAVAPAPDRGAGNHIGTVVRERRLRLGLTQAALAARIGRSPSYVSVLESGGTLPSLTTLRQIAEALETVVAAFFETPGTPPGENGGAGDRSRPRTVRPASRKVLIDPTRGDVRWELLSPDLQGQLEVVQVALAPGAVVGKEAWLRHAGEECGVVLEGTLEVEFEDETVTLAAGDSITFASTRPHRLRNRSDGETVAIWIITPPSF